MEQETDEYAAKYGHSKKVAALSSLQQTLMNQNKTALLFTQGGKTHHIWGQRDTSDEEHKTDFTERESGLSLQRYQTDDSPCTLKSLRLTSAEKPRPLRATTSTSSTRA